MVIGVYTAIKADRLSNTVLSPIAMTLAVFSKIPVISGVLATATYIAHEHIFRIKSGKPMFRVVTSLRRVPAIAMYAVLILSAYLVLHSKRT